MPHLVTDPSGYSKIVDGGVAGPPRMPVQQAVSIATAEAQIQRIAYALLAVHRELGYLTTTPDFMLRQQALAYQQSVGGALEALRGRWVGQQQVASGFVVPVQQAAP